MPGSLIIFGEISPIDRKPYPHLWVEQKGEIVDEVCPPEQTGCDVRRQFARVRPASLQIYIQNPQSEKDLNRIKWGIEYLKGLKSALEVSSPLP